jgi:hypothetical protein
MVYSPQTSHIFPSPDTLLQQSQIGYVMIVFRAYDAATISLIMKDSWEEIGLGWMRWSIFRSTRQGYTGVI